LLPATAFSADLLSVYELALENDDQLSAARNEKDAVLQVERQKKGLYYPSLDVAYDHIETNQVINRSDNEVFGSGESDFPTDEIVLALNQPIFRLDYFNQRKVGKAEVSQADYQLVAAEQELMLRAAESYLLTLAAMDNVYVTEKERDVYAQQLKLTEKRLDVGLSHPAEVYESRARVDFNQAELIRAENEVIDQQEGIRVITGVPIDDLLPLEADFPMVPPEPADQNSWIEKSLQNNLQVKALEAALEVATAQYKVQKAKYFPTLDFVARFNNRDSGGSLFGGGSDVDTTDLMLRAKWDAFEGGIIRARVKEAHFLMQRAQDELDLQRANVRRDTRNAYLGVVSSIAKAKSLKSSMEAQEYTVKAKRKGFETGVVPNIQVLDAERDYFFVQRDYLKARYEYLLSLLKLKLQVGTLSPDDLAMINGLLSAAPAGNAVGSGPASGPVYADLPKEGASKTGEQPAVDSTASSSPGGGYLLSAPPGMPVLDNSDLPAQAHDMTLAATQQ
jgi:outer membrane protein